MKGVPRKDVIVTQDTIIFKLLASKNKVLLVWGDPFLVLDFGRDILDGVRTFHFKSDGLACECLDEDYRHSLRYRSVFA